MWATQRSSAGTPSASARSAGRPVQREGAPDVLPVDCDCGASVFAGEPDAAALSDALTLLRITDATAQTLRRPVTMLGGNGTSGWVLQRDKKARRRTRVGQSSRRRARPSGSSAGSWRAASAPPTWNTPLARCSPVDALRVRSLERIRARALDHVDERARVEDHLPARRQRARARQGRSAPA
jgi:hypothetical protein